MSLHDDIKQRRIELGLTMADVAQSVGVSEATISRWESGDIANVIKLYLWQKPCMYPLHL